MGKSKAVQETKTCGKCNKTFVKTEYKIIFSGKCGKWVCPKYSALRKSEIDEISKNNSAWKCKDCNQRSRRPVIHPIESSDDEETGQYEQDDKNEVYTIEDIMEQMQKNHEKNKRYKRV
ncbi:hypothetical protein HHI36_007736 [Cryptolaemus montrouzieri]|uniref:Uncharacterized protein n=1 Tax=Cryptolaemus montrouzieri TaxID=559131 RepID=A0ABD2MQQ9_9CUCU